MDIGMPFDSDFNSGKQEGTVHYQSAVRYLMPALRWPNVEWPINVMAKRIVIEERRAKDVEIVKTGAFTRVDATTKVIVTSGTIGSPRQRMLSGIGSSTHFKSAEVDVVRDLPGIEQKFRDRFSTDANGQLSGAHSLNKYKQPHWAAFMVLRDCVYVTVQSRYESYPPTPMPQQLLLQKRPPR